MCLSLNSLAIFIVLLGAIFYGLYFNTLQQTPHVTLEQLQDGAQGLQKGDRMIEYFISGGGDGIPVFWIHGAGSTGRAGTFLGPNALKHGFKIISLSLPGTGGTSPIIGRGYFEGAEDILSVAHHLGVGMFHVMGVSYGSGTAAAVAIRAPDRIISVQLIVPAWPSMEDFDFRQKDAGFMQNLNTWPYTDRVMAFYLGKLDLNITEILKIAAPEDVAYVEKVAPEQLKETEIEYKRANRFHHEGSCELSGIMRTRGQEIYDKREILKAMGSKVSLWYGTKDTIANPEGVNLIRSMLPKAKIFPIEHGHLGSLIETTKFLKELQENSNNKK
eukprot:TRINITY_DN17006_c0_g2_i9.p1 TRINITY_DN17006_c0_g2~~TRINITY_DN17006_c0_g2_i9.p1  ORF type:complete len:330 (-),score=61.16 TRINITY_DN17006_c0_g2_i9:177-1166(-)